MQIRRFGPRQCSLAELSDEELLVEVQARRDRRARPRGAAITAASAEPAAGSQGESGGSAQQPHARPSPAADVTIATPRRSRAVRQWLANLELSESATLADVEAAFERLRQTYEPVTQAADAKRRATAELLMSSLREAYNGLRMHLS